MKRVLLLMIRFYQVALSPSLAFLTGCRCRFHPSCSHYAMEAIQQHGVFKGIALGAYRILRCNPWGGSGYDPVPASRTGLTVHPSPAASPVNQTWELSRPGSTELGGKETK